MDKICVLLATFNGERFIEEQILSIQNQKNVLVDIYAWDDGSTDKTISFLRKYNISIVGSGSRFGKPCVTFYSLCLGINKKYDYYAFADQDDIWFPNKLYEGLLIIKKNHIDLYGSNLISYDFSNKLSLIRRDTKPTKFDYLYQGLSAGCTYIFTAKLYLILKNSIKNKEISELYFSHDWFIYALARNYKLPTYCDNRAFIIYRQHQSNVSSSNTNFNAILRKILNILTFEHKIERKKIHDLILYKEVKLSLIKNIFSLKRSRLISFFYTLLILIGF
jgi:rhamnosyltransferase